MIHLFRPDSIDRLNGVSYALTLLSTPIKLRETHKTLIISIKQVSILIFLYFVL